MANEDYRVTERIIQAGIIRLLRIHPKVAWAQRINSGAGKKKGFYVRFGFTGCSDIIGQLRDGRFLAIECKTGEGKLTDEQHNFLERVKRSHGVAGVCRSIADADSLLGAA